LRGISELRLKSVEDLKPAFRGYFNDLKQSAWKMSRRTRGKIEI
jgi:hypothetical protein